MLTLLELPLRRNRDIVLARQWARQLAGLLGFEPRAQLGIAGAVFEIAWQALWRKGAATLHFHTDDGWLKVGAAGSGLRLEKPLPQQASHLSREDMLFVVQQFAECNPLDLFEEIHQQNRELLRLLHDLTVAERLDLADRELGKPSAA